MSFLPYFDHPVELTSRADGRPKSVHVFDTDSIDALNAALAADRPLLVRGEPGTGKSQLARAAAQVSKRAFCSAVIDARTESRDLLYTLDAVARLADAQVDDARRGPDGRLLLDPYLAPGPLWWAFQWKEAKTQSEASSTQSPRAPAGWQPEQGVVVLLDEIDKADVTVPNGLLEALGQGRFMVPGGREIRRPPSEESRPPLVIVTTNEERALPDAFLRRCLVLHLALPTARQDLLDRLVEWGGAHFPECHGQVLLLAAEMLADDRAQLQDQGLAAPGGAEYVDLLRTALRLAADPSTPGLKATDPLERQIELLERNRRFAYDKHPPEQAW